MPERNQKTSDVEIIKHSMKNRRGRSGMQVLREIKIIPKEESPIDVKGTLDQVQSAGQTLRRRNKKRRK